MPPHGGHHGGHHHGGGGGWGWGGYPAFYDGGGPTIVIDNAASGCVVTDQAGVTRIVPCALGDDDEPAPRPKSAVPILRSAIGIAAGGRGAGRGSTPYYRFAAQARSYPFDWNGRPGGVPSSRVAAESRELGNADLIESGGGPYANMAWPPLASRNFRLRPPGPLSGVLDGLSDNEVKAAKIAAAAGALFLIWRHVRRRGR